MPINIDLNKYKRPGIFITEGYEEWFPRIKDLSHEQILDSLPFDVIERYVRQKKLNNIKK